MDRKLNGGVGELDSLPDFARYVLHNCESQVTIIFDMWMKFYKLLKNAININIEKNLGTYGKHYVSMHQSTILEIENRAKESCGKLNRCFGTK